MENTKEVPALLVLNRLLIDKAGLTQQQSDALMARFLEQEANRYVEVMDAVENSLEKKPNVKNFS